MVEILEEFQEIKESVLALWGKIKCIYKFELWYLITLTEYFPVVNLVCMLWIKPFSMVHLKTLWSQSVNRDTVCHCFSFNQILF